MKFSHREQMLLLVTGAALLGGITYIAAQRQVKAWQGALAKEGEVRHHLELTQRLVGQQSVWDNKLAKLRNRLPVYPAAKDVTADLLIRLEKLASGSQLSLLSRDVERESRQGDLYELSASCRWEGSLDALVHFLFDLQQDDAILDVSQLTVSPTDKKPLRGTLTVYCSYTRQPVPGATNAGISAASTPSSKGESH
ncbi:MAG: GspMb/PilO family protein [bacterium]